MKSLLFVCVNNFGKSPLAAALYRAGLGEAASNVQVESAGAFAGGAERAVDQRLLDLAAKRGLDLSQHLTRTVEAEELLRFSQIIVLDRDSYEQCFRLLPRAEFDRRVRRFVDLFGDASLHEIPDATLGEASFEEMYELVEKGIANFLREVGISYIPTKIGP